MNNRISAVIIDQSRSSVEYLHTIIRVAFSEQIVVIKVEMDYAKSISTVVNHNPDLVFMDINMGRLDNFKLLHGLREQGNHSDIIFHAKSQDYAAEVVGLDVAGYLVKNQKDDLQNREVIDSYLLRRKKKKAQREETIQKLQAISMSSPTEGNNIFLPSLSGFKGISINQIVYFRRAKIVGTDRSVWEVVLANSSTIKLSQKYTAKGILLKMPDYFCAVHQSFIVNQKYIEEIEAKNRVCKLIALEKKKCTLIPISRRCWGELKKSLEFG